MYVNLLTYIEEVSIVEDQPTVRSILCETLPLVNFRHDNDMINPNHTIQECKKMAGQNTFQILVLNDANMIGEH